jgi:hypothetical protein
MVTSIAGKLTPWSACRDVADGNRDVKRRVERAKEALKPPVLTSTRIADPGLVSEITTVWHASPAVILGCRCGLNRPVLPSEYSYSLTQVTARLLSTLPMRCNHP